MKYILLILFFFTNNFTFSQEKSKPIQVSGVILGDSARRAAFVTVVDINSGNRWTYTDLKGYFSMVAFEGDTLVMNSVGYKTEYVIIPKNLENNFFSVVAQLKLDEVSLPMVNVFSITPEEFKKLFLSIKIPDDDLERAKKNLDKQVMTALSSAMTMDGKENSTMFFNYNNTNNYYRQTGMVRPLPFLDPFAIYQFVKLWKEGKINLKNE